MATVGELLRGLDPLFRTAEQALKARDALKAAQAVEEGLASVRQQMEQAVREAHAAREEADRQQARLEDEKRRVAQELERFRKDQTAEILRRREDLRQDIIALGQEAEAQRLRLERARQDAGLAERAHQEALRQMGVEQVGLEGEHQRIAAARRKEIEDLTRELSARRQALQEVNQQIAELARR